MSTALLPAPSRSSQVPSIPTQKLIMNGRFRTRSFECTTLVATSILFGAFWGPPRNPRKTGHKAPRNCHETRSRILQDTLSNTPGGGGLRPPPPGVLAGVSGSLSSEFRASFRVPRDLFSVDFEWCPQKAPNKMDVATCSRSLFTVPVQI